MSYRCPICSNELDQVKVFSECLQMGEIDDQGVIHDYTSVQEVFETTAINCPDCGADLMPYVREE